ncbi:MAG: hypothetical protein ACE5JU_25375, partial [Candidatus Binatia bacterium]
MTSRRRYLAFFWLVRALWWVIVFFDSVILTSLGVKYYVGGLDGVRGWIVHTWADPRYRGWSGEGNAMERAIRQAMSAYEYFALTCIIAERFRRFV